MTPPLLFRKPILLISLAFSLLGFGVGFGISYQQDTLHVREVGQLAWFHLHYAIELKDDMAIIDWSKNLENLQGVLTFQAVNDSKIVTGGGNRNFLPLKISDGISYSFPDKWVFHIATKKTAKSLEEFTLVYSAWPGPFLWGSFIFFICFVAGISVSSGLTSLLSPPKDLKSAPALAAPKSVLPTVRVQNSPTENSENPFLFLDKHYVIQQVTPEAAKLLGRTSAELVNGHLFDLSPEPDLMRALEKGKEIKLLKPFLSYPDLSVSLKPDPNGTLLFLEKSELAKATEKR